MSDGVAGYPDEQRLIAALRGGDRQAFERIVDEWSPALLRTALAYVPSRAVAEEVVQDTWLGVLQGLGRFEGRSALRTWVFQILLNNARTRGQRERRTIPFSSMLRRDRNGSGGPSVDPSRFQGRRGEQPGAWARPPADWESPAAKLATAEARLAMLQAIAALPARQREVLTLRDIQGWGAEETCNALDLTESNQRVLLHRARAKVREALERHFEEQGE